MNRLMKAYSEKPVKGDIFRLRSLKVTLDDILKQYLTSVLGLKQHYLMSDIKISIGIISIVSAGILVYMSMNIDFIVYKPYAIIILVLYFTSNLLLEAYLLFFPEPTFKGKKGEVSLVVRSEVKSPHPIYILKVCSGKSKIPKKYTKSLYDLFYSDGILLHEKYLSDLEELFAEFKGS